MYIVGAGLTGCIASFIFPEATILEAKDSTISNHRAVLRFRTDAVSKVTGIPFRKVKVNKGIWNDGKFVNPNPEVISLYSRKVLGYITNRSICNIDTVERFIAPENFHKQLCDMLDNRIRYNTPFEIEKHTLSNHAIISTMPLPILAGMFAHPIRDNDFRHKAICVTREHVLDCDMHATIYYPDHPMKIYRATLTGSELIVESIAPPIDAEMQVVYDSFGIPMHLLNGECSQNEQKYGKILEIDDNARKQFIYDMSVRENIFSLGRFAIWKNVLLDDALEDMYVIKHLINKGIYDRSRHHGCK